MTNKFDQVVGVMIAKRDSTRLPNKNRLDFNGKPLFEWNLKKMVAIFDRVVFDSDCPQMLLAASQLGAEPHARVKSLLGHDVPSIPIFESILDDIKNVKNIINVQANSPNVSEALIKKAAVIIKYHDVNELLTMYADRTINGSVWGLSKDRIKNYGDYYEHHPDILLLDNSIDIHTRAEFDEALNAC